MERLFADGAGHKVPRRFPLPAPSYAHTKRLVSGFWPEGDSKWARRVAEVVCVSQGGAGGSGESVVVVIVVGKWFPLGMRDTVCSSGLSYEFRKLVNASINGSNNPKRRSKRRPG